MEDPDVKFEDVNVSERNIRTSHLRRIAVVNLKKLAGGATADPRLVMEHALRDKDLLMRQLALYSAHLTFACGTFEVLKQLAKQSGRLPETVPKANGVHKHFKDERLGTEVDFRHPQARESIVGMFEAFRTNLKYHVSR